uniref:Fibronectin type-III domain-containing protein n=1 Tax=Amphimedon queenslandica TaxID=400682 RepID=A0A1X7SY11_AMPQE
LLDSVVDLDYTFINGSSVLLTWTAPYTLDNVPITGYYIVVNGSVNITINNTNIILSATNPDPCIYNVSVSPINDVGIGSSNDISFYNETVPLITPPVSVVPVIDGQLISLNISINVSTICKGEYPNSITVNILNTDNTVIKNASIPTQVNYQLMITGVIAVPINLYTFVANVSLSNNGGTFNNMSSFTFSFLGPVTNISSSIDNCSTIDITWTAPTVDDRVPILYYILRMYDAITGSLVKNVSVYDTSYQFVDDNLYIHRYTYVITGVNELGEGASNNDTFSYQRIPRSTKANTSLDILSYTQDIVIAELNIPVILKCTGEAPEHVTVTVLCNGTNSSTTFLIEPKNNFTDLLPVPLYQECTISILFSNGVGSSEGFSLAFDAFPPNITTTCTETSTKTSGTETSPTTIPVSPTPSVSTVIIISSSVIGILILIMLITMCLTIAVCYCHKNK